MFLAWTCGSICLIPNLRVGLEQEIALPDGSHVIKYLVMLREHLSVGPPVYFVVNSTNQDLSQADFQDRICGSQGCSPDSLQVRS